MLDKTTKKPMSTPLTPGTKQYGLILPKKKSINKKELSTGFNAFAAAAKKNNQKKKEEGTKTNGYQDEGARSVQQRQGDKIRAQALAEDAAVFDYDAVYDDMKRARESKMCQIAATRELEKKKPKYINTLLQQAKIREVENERIRERRLLHERNADDAQYGDKEKLVSASYKRKLQEMQKWEAEDARLAAMEEQEDVTKQGEHAMAEFYANLNKNIAMGGTTKNARSAYTAKEAQSVTCRSVEPVRAVQDERDGAYEHEPEKPNDDEAATKKVKIDEQRDKGRYASARDTVIETKDTHAKNTNVSLLQADQNEQPNKEDAIAAAKARFLTRKAQRNTKTT